MELFQKLDILIQAQVSYRQKRDFVTRHLEFNAPVPAEKYAALNDAALQYKCALDDFLDLPTHSSQA